MEIENCMDQPELIILGGGGHAAVVYEAASLQGWKIIGFLDDSIDATLPCAHAHHLGTLNNPPEKTRQMIRDGVSVHAAAGSVELRRAWYQLFSDAHAGIVLHPSAAISASASFADGVFVGPHAVVNARAQVGRGVIVNSGSILEHDVVVGEFAHLAPGSIATGEVHIANDVMVGAGAVILPRLSVSRGSVIGAGSVVVNDVNEGVTVAGNPAAEIR